mmetsp:Transcript_16420/g.29072  ORF Transcript_16420/g.29072 Transcript_16420/m.29072 type:complete len:92 (+) Transcript_16420:566-841(+)
MPRWLLCTGETKCPLLSNRVGLTGQSGICNIAEWAFPVEANVVFLDDHFLETRPQLHHRDPKVGLVKARRRRTDALRLMDQKALASTYEAT